MKFLYCPRCKEVRAKTWYQRRDRCLSCIGPATPIHVPNGYLTYATYFLYVFVPGLVVAYLITDDKNYLWMSIAFLVVMMVTAYMDLTRAEKIARAKVKIGTSRLNEFRRRGWT